MRRVRLNVEELEIQSFETDDDAQKRRGTVHAYQQDSYRQYTCDGTCDQTCGAPASCNPPGTWCGTYPEHGCPNSLWYCTDEVWVC